MRRAQDLRPSPAKPTESITISRTLGQLSELIDAKTKVINDYQQLIMDSDRRVNQAEQNFMDRLLEFVLYKGDVRSDTRVHPSDLHRQVTSEKADRYRLITARNTSIEERMDYCNQFFQLVASNKLDSFEQTAPQDTPAQVKPSWKRGLFGAREQNENNYLV